MPSISPQDPNPIDRNAVSSDRQRRNWQRAASGALTGTIKVLAPLVAGIPIKLAYLTSTGLGLVSNSLALLFADGSIVGSSTGIKVQEQAAGGISTGGTGIAVDSTVVRITRQISTAAPLTGGGDLSADRTLSIPVATSTANGYLSSTDWTTFNNKQPAGNYLAGSTALGTTLPLTGGGNLSTGLTLGVNVFGASGSTHATGVVPDPGSTAGSTRFLREDATWGTPSGGGSSLSPADASIQFPTTSTISVLPYHGLSTEAGGLALYSDAASGLGPQITVSVTLNSTSSHTTRLGVAAFVSSTSTGNTQGNNAVFGDFHIADGVGAPSVVLYQGSTNLGSTTVRNLFSSTTVTVCTMLINGATASLLVNGSTMVVATIATNDFSAVGFFGDSSASICRIRSWGASTGTVVLINDHFDNGTYNSSQTLAVQNPNYQSFSLTGGFGTPLPIFNSSTNTELTQPPSSTSGSEGLAINTNDAQAYVYGPTRSTRYEWGAAVAPASGLRVSTFGLSVLPADSSLSTGTMGLTVTGFQPMASDPVSPFTGQGWFNSTIGQAKVNLITSTTSLPADLVSLFWNGANSSVISNTTTKIGFTPTVTIPAGFFNTLGRAIRLTAVLGQSYSTGTFTLSLNWGGATGILIWSQTFSSNASNTWIEILLTVTTTGSSGSFLAVGRTGGASQATAFANLATTVNLTTANVLTFAGQWSAANANNQAQLSYWTAELIA